MSNIEEWIARSNNSAIKEFRQAVHTVLLAVSNSRYLQTKMVMKGGVLLAIRFKGLRLTRDIDFSTSEQYDTNKEVKFKSTLEGKCLTVLRIDYSYNEISQEIDLFEFQKGRKIKTYSISDLVGEKYRAIIQQKSRNRIRRQDAFDIYWLLKNGELEDQELKKSIHNSIIIKEEVCHSGLHFPAFEDGVRSF